MVGGRSFKVLIYTYAAFLYVFRAEVVKTTCAVDIDAMLTGRDMIDNLTLVGKDFLAGVVA